MIDYTMIHNEASHFIKMVAGSEQLMEDLKSSMQKIALQHDRAARPEAAPTWIPVEERLPDDPDEQVLVVARDFGLGVDCYRFGPDGNDWENFGDEVTHWMPLPAAPLPHSSAEKRTRNN